MPDRHLKTQILPISCGCCLWSHCHCPLQVPSPLPGGRWEQCFSLFCCPSLPRLPQPSYFIFFLCLQNGRVAAGLAGLDPGNLSGLRPNSSSGVLEHEGHRFDISLRPPCPSCSAEHSEVTAGGALNCTRVFCVLPVPPDPSTATPSSPCLCPALLSALTGLRT